MPLSDDQLKSVLEGQLTPAEREQGVLYSLSGHVASGSKLEFSRTTIHVPWDAVLAFVDREPDGLLTIFGAD